MKTLTALNNVEKAKLLHELFPDEIPALLAFAKNLGLAIQEEQDRHRQKWDNGLFSFDFWLNLIKEAETKINKYGDTMQGSSRLFADQLFDGYIAMYTVHCLIVYTTTRNHPNRKFTVAVDLLFNP